MKALVLAVLLAQQFLWQAAAHAQSAIDSELSRQEEIYKTQGENVPTGYVTDRALLSYGANLYPGFSRALANLVPGDRWLDIGAGQGRAILEYYTPRFDAMNPEGRERRGRKAQAVAMSIEDRRTQQWHDAAARLEPNQVRYLFGRRLREYSPEELGRFQLVSDVAGGFSYTRFISVYMERMLGALVVGGSFYSILLDVVPEQAAGKAAFPETRFLTEIADAGGAELRVCSWLKRISCVEVACEPRVEAKRPIEVYRIRKTCDAVAVPALELVHYESGTPPVRRYVLKQ